MAHERPSGFSGSTSCVKRHVGFAGCMTEALRLMSGCVFASYTVSVLCFCLSSELTAVSSLAGLLRLSTYAKRLRSASPEQVCDGGVLQHELQAEHRFSEDRNSSDTGTRIDRPPGSLSRNFFSYGDSVDLSELPDSTLTSTTQPPSQPFRDATLSLLDSSQGVSSSPAPPFSQDLEPTSEGHISVCTPYDLNAPGDTEEVARNNDLPPLPLDIAGLDSLTERGGTDSPGPSAAPMEENASACGTAAEVTIEDVERPSPPVSSRSLVQSDEDNRMDQTELQPKGGIMVEDPRGTSSKTLVCGAERLTVDGPDHHISPESSVSAEQVRRIFHLLHARPSLTPPQTIPAERAPAPAQAAPPPETTGPQDSLSAVAPQPSKLKNSKQKLLAKLGGVKRLVRTSSKRPSAC